MSEARIVIVGAGGHGRVVLDVLRRQGGAEVLGFLDDRPELAGREVNGVPVLGGPADADVVARIAATHFLAAIGDNDARAKQFERMRELGLRPWTAVHPATTLADGVSIGAGAQIIAGVVVNPNASIGKDAVLDTSCSVDHDCRIGDHALVGPGAHLGGAVTVRDLAFLGIGVAVLPGVSIGEGAMVGAGAVVVEDVPERTVAVGVPARVVRKIQP